MQGVNDLVGSPIAEPADMVAGVEPNAAPSRRGRGFAAMLPGRGDVVTDGTEWIVAVLVLGSLVFLISLRAGGFQSVIAAR
jgi:hypothetical protein